MAGSLLQAGAQARCLALEKITALAAELISWRADNEIQILQAEKGGGRVFDFVKGLRFSSRLIYIMRDALSRDDVEVNWGQVFDAEGAHLSRECDIIVHKNGCHSKWNGHAGGTSQVMDFRFITAADVLAVVSCKSLLTSLTKDHKEYCRRLKPYLKRRKLWLFAECIPKGKERPLSKAARQAGYERLWYLYNWDDENSSTETDKGLWLRFLDEVRRLA